MTAGKGGYVYILGSRQMTLYVGVTSDLERRVWQHKTKAIEGFTSKYGVDRLLYFERFERIEGAIEREKQIKRWRREKKLDLVETMNAGYLDLAEDWFDGTKH